MNRRTFLGSAAGMALGGLRAQVPSFPIIDTHIHLFDPTRPQGVPWPPKDTVMYRPALPARYRALTKTLGIKGAIEVECSPWLEDNQWVLDVAAKDKIMVGTVGDLEPGKPDFRRQLERFHKNPLFLGIRYGYLWDRDLRAEMAKPEFISGLKELAAAGLELDTANASLRLLSDVVRLTDQVPDLRIVIDHLPSMDPPQEAAARATYQDALQELRKRPQVYVKVSEVLRRSGGRVHYELSFYRSRLDEIWDVFGPDRLLYGSDWPNSDPLGTYSQVLHVVREYFTSKGQEAVEKFFWKNSVAAYRWKKREAGQPAA
ncbi:MAG TPA: amidohydrolase family protein [Bryobacterales bacterium]|nr:amidohydrolase family protein [Bryobacterales bacterium]